MIQVFKTSFFALGAGFLLQIGTEWLKSDFLNTFFKESLITILVALLAINSATLSIVLSRIRDLTEKQGAGGGYFRKTRTQMVLSIREQVGLIIAAIILLSIAGSPFVRRVDNLEFLLNSFIAGTFIYALIVLYDTAKSVLIILDFELDGE